MKKILLTFFSFLWLLPLHSAPLYILPLGDSLTLGVSSGAAGPYVLGGYRGYLFSILNQMHLEPAFVGTTTFNSLVPRVPAAYSYHNGYSGFRIDQLRSNFDKEMHWLKNLRTKNSVLVDPSQVNFILLMAGTNDIIQNADSAIAFGRMYDLLNYLSMTFPNSHILVASIPPLYSSFMVTPLKISYAMGYNAALASYIAQIAPFQPKIHFVDQFTPLYWSGTFLLGDGVHPTSSTGFSLMANMWLKSILEVLNQK